MHKSDGKECKCTQTCVRGRAGERAMHAASPRLESQRGKQADSTLGGNRDFGAKRGKHVGSSLLSSFFNPSPLLHSHRRTRHIRKGNSVKLTGRENDRRFFLRKRRVEGEGGEERVAEVNGGGGIFGGSQ